MNQMVFELCSGTIRLEVERDLTLFSMGGRQTPIQYGGGGGGKPLPLTSFFLEIIPPH